MKYTKYILTLSIIACGLCASVCVAESDKPQAAPASDDSFWSEEMTNSEPPMNMPEERINQFINQIRSQDTARADELEKLRKEDPEKFHAQIREEFIKRFQQMRKQRDLRPEGGPEGRPEGPDDHPGFGEGPQPPRGGFGQGSGPDRPRIPGQSGQGYWKERLEKMHNELLSWLEKNYPDQAVQLKTLRENQPDEYVMKIAELMRKYEPIRRAEHDNPKLAEVMKEDLENQRQRDELLKQYSTAKQENKEAIKARLKEVVSHRFDLIMAKKQMQYDDLRKRLEDLQKEVKTRESELEKLKTNKQKAVEEHLGDLITETNKEHWN